MDRGEPFRAPLEKGTGPEGGEPTWAPAETEQTEASPSGFPQIQERLEASPPGLSLRQEQEWAEASPPGLLWKEEQDRREASPPGLPLGIDRGQALQSLLCSRNRN